MTLGVSRPHSSVTLISGGDQFGYHIRSSHKADAQKNPVIERDRFRAEEKCKLSAIYAYGIDRHLKQQNIEPYLCGGDTVHEQGRTGDLTLPVKFSFKRNVQGNVLRTSHHLVK